MNCAAELLKGISFARTAADTPPQATTEVESVFDPKPSNSRETHTELAVGGPLTAAQKPERGTRWVSATASTLCFALVLAGGPSPAPAEPLDPTTPEVSHSLAGPDITRKLEQDLAVLFEKIRSALETRVKVKTDAIVEQATQAQRAALERHFERNIRVSLELSNHVERQLASLLH